MSRISEYFPDADEFDSPRLDSPSLKLEKRGTTSQIHQTLLWEKATIHKNTVAAKLRSVARTTEALTLENCHTFYTVAVCNGCNAHQKFPNRCENFYCPECQPRISQDRKRAVEWWTRTIDQPKHVVLTVKNVRHLTKAHVKEFRGWFSKLRRTKFARNWLGGFYSLEVTEEGRGWHLHLHALIDARWIDKMELSRQWSRISNNAARIVEVKDARGENYLREVTKYTVKGVQLAAWTPEKIATFIDAFRGVRTFGVFGSLYGKRTQFRDWWKQVRGTKPKCSCGCVECRYFSEAEWLIAELTIGPTRTTVPPPPGEVQHELSLLR